MDFYSSVSFLLCLFSLLSSNVFSIRGFFFVTLFTSISLLSVNSYFPWVGLGGVGMDGWESGSEEGFFFEIEGFGAGARFHEEGYFLYTFFSYYLLITGHVL